MSRQWTGPLKTLVDGETNVYRFQLFMIWTCFLAATLFAQPTRPTQGVEAGGQVGAGFGLAIASLGDVDGDGADDTAFGEPGAGTSNQGRIVVRSGLTGVVLWSIAGSQSDELLGEAMIAMPDRDNDGIAELAIWHRGSLPLSAGPPPQLTLHSGATGSLIVSLPFPTLVRPGLAASLTMAGDLDGDGRRELAVANITQASGPFQTNELMVINTSTGAVAAQSEIFFVSAEASLTRGPDINGDGIEEILVGRPTRGAGPSGVAEGKVVMRDGATLAPLWSSFGLFTWSRFGASQVLVPDLTNDGIDDFLVGAPGDRQFAPNIGYVLALDATTGAIIHSTFSPPTVTGFGASLLRWPGASPAQANAIFVGNRIDPTLSGPTSSPGAIFSLGVQGLAEQVRIQAPAPLPCGVVLAASYGDHDGNGALDLAIAVPAWQESEVGKVYAVNTPGAELYGTGRGGANTLSLSSQEPSLYLNGFVSLVLEGLSVGTPGFLGVSTQRSSVPMFGGTVLIDMASPAFFSFALHPADMFGRTNLSLPPNSGFAGKSFVAQGFGLTPAGLAFSNGLDLRL